MTDSVALVGGSGFVGGAVLRELRNSERDVFEVERAEFDRLRANFALPSTNDPSAFASEVMDQILAIDTNRLRAVLEPASVVINAAGAATPLGQMSADMAWANVAIPALLVLAASGRASLIHISSAAVQGSMPLDESENYDASTPYSLTKAAGEQVLTLGSKCGPRVVAYRPTSVHGPDRDLTQQLQSALSFPVLPRITGNSEPLSIISVKDVARAVSFLAGNADRFDRSCWIALHPNVGMHQRHLVRPAGKRMVPVPSFLVSAMVMLLNRFPVPQFRGLARRLQAGLVGQPQHAKFLLEAGFEPMTIPETISAIGLFGNKND